ncbi:Smr-domain-containing protein [Xylona heveae TC161]|uniref:Smr-domain-containing protein n=1 Tax=Xylona heveae (strain CBS 132557 / TC161) TaxID=1328760 RepID=A0A165HJX6_XYLHT|nr:Smr-domain-containing protein [Xylona heveae TC161]KZF23625.1 Smr-domain-containing protein [Xylona heveae TC161]
MSYPLTQLGGGAFSHSQSQDAEAEYDRLRDLARQERDKRHSCSQRAHEAKDRGDRQEADRLFDEGDKHQRNAEHYNKQASEFIFRENNAQGRVADDAIDLHGQFVEEAEDILEQRIRTAQAQGQTHLHVIVGKGNHSANHLQKLKPKVEQLCRDLGLNYETEENAGRIYINLQGGPVQKPSPQHFAGHPSQQERPQQYQPGYPGQQQQPYYGRQEQPQQQQQQQQPDEVEEIVKKVVPKIFKKLEGCCVVM